MLYQGVKTMGSIVVYGILLAIGFRIGQKAYEFAEENVPPNAVKLTKYVKGVYDDYTRGINSSKETGNQPAS